MGIDLSKIKIIISGCAIKHDGRDIEFYSPKELGFLNKIKSEEKKTLEEQSNEPIM